MLKTSAIFLCVFGWFLLGSSALATDAEEAPLITQDTLYVLDFLLARDVVEREPVDVVQSFTMEDNRAWAFARLYNSAGMVDVTFRWYYEDNEYFVMDSRIGSSPNWRTYSSVTLQPGVWRVELYDHNGNQLREIRFYVSE